MITNICWVLVIHSSFIRISFTLYYNSVITPIFKCYLFVCLFIYLFMAALGLRFCARAFSSCGERGLFFVAVCRLLIVVASLVVERGL